MPKLVPWLYDLQMGMVKEIRPRREAVVEHVRGRTLELGIGTGLNLPLYPPGATVVGVDPDPAMLGRARGRAHTAPVPVRLLAAAGEALPLRDGAFDRVVVTLALCSVASPDQALAEIHRVLVSGGHLHFMEHVRSDASGWARLQDLFCPLCRAGCGG
jgi:ubiquinone/menaquinone biosynthesis C-methylase UbiE